MRDNIRSSGVSVSDTNALKGVALLMLLWHHLYYAGDMPIDEITIVNHPIVLTTANWCKVCVSLFVFLSGYGLTVSAMKNDGIGNLWQYYKKRYVKLMINYWFIYLLFVPFGVFVMGIDFDNVYHGSIWRPIFDLFGLHFAITGDYCGYNPTWWFYSCIIVLYLLYPLLFLIRNLWYLLIPLSIVFSYLASGLPVVHACANYLLSFVLGISVAVQQIKIVNGGGEKNISVHYVDTDFVVQTT